MDPALLLFIFGGVIIAIVNLSEYWRKVIPVFIWASVASYGVMNPREWSTKWPPNSNSKER